MTKKRREREEERGEAKGKDGVVKRGGEKWRKGGRISKRPTGIRRAIT